MSTSMRPRPDEHVDRPVTPLLAALWSIALTTLMTVAVGATEAARPGAQADIVNLTACQVLATSAVVFAMVRLHARDVSLRLTLGVRPIAPIHVVLSAAAGAGLYPLTSVVDAAIVRRWPLDDDAAAQSAKVVASASHGAFVVAALVVTPIAFELFFRGILYGGLRACTNVRTALFATTVFYACSYMDPPQLLPTALVLGLAMAWLRERSGTVLAPVVGVLAFGAVDGIPILRGRDPSVDLAFPAKWIVGGALIAALALAGIGAGRTEEA